MSKDKPKILLLGKLPPPYMGPAIATEIILNSKLSERYELIHFDTRINKNISGIGRFSIEKVINMLSLYLNFQKLIKRSNPDVVLVPISQTTIGFIKDAVFITLAEKSNTKVVIQLRGSNLLNWYNKTSRVIQRFVKRNIEKVNGAIVLGENLRYLFEPFLNAEKIFVVPNGANFPVVLNTEKHDKIKVLYLANFIESKGFFDVLQAIKIIQENENEFEFIAAGSWMNEKFKNKCESFIAENNLSVQILGSVDGKEKAKLFSNSDVFLFTPNEPEGHPWVLVEAAAFSLPIISTNQGAIVSTVEDQKNGFIVSEHSPKEIVNKLLKLKDLNLRVNMGNASRLIYEERFTEDAMVNDFSIVFNSILES